MQHRWYHYVLALGLFVTCCWGAVRGVQSIRYTRDIGGHLKLAADANSTDIAERQLRIAVSGMERWGLCNEVREPDKNASCYTSVLWTTPDEDVGFWRENIEATLADLEAMSPEERADNLVESNQLLKVRETLLDTGKNGDKITSPDGISVYPYNALWGFLGLVGLVCLILGGGKLYLRAI